MQDDELDELIQSNEETAEYVHVIFCYERHIDMDPSIVSEIVIGLKYVTDVKVFNHNHRFPVACLEPFFTHGKDRVESISLSVPHLVGDRTDFTKAFQALSRMTELRRFRMSYPGAVYRPPVSDVYDDNLVDALNGIATLETVELVELLVSTAANSSLHRLCESRSSKKSNDVSFCLELVDMQVSNTLIESVLGKRSRVTRFSLANVPDMQRTLETMTEQLQNSTKLKSLTLQEFEVQNILSVQDGLRLLNVLKNNKVLKELTLELNDDLGNAQYGGSLVDFVQQNRSLQRLYLKIADDNISQLLRGLAENRSLRVLGLEIVSVHPRETKHIVRKKHLVNECLEVALKENFYLEDISISVCGHFCELSKEVRFWLKLNTAGRRYLQQNLQDRERWTAAMLEHKNDLSILFHLLTLNPTLLAYPLKVPVRKSCERDGESETKQTINKRNSRKRKL